MPKHKHDSDPARVLNAPGFLRLRAIVGPHGLIPVSKSTWWAGVASGRFPKPVKLSPRITAWRTQDILDLIKQISHAG